MITITNLLLYIPYLFTILTLLNHLYISGTISAIVELIVFGNIAYNIRNSLSFDNIDNITYYWLCFTILTGLWELTYLSRKNEISNISKILIKDNSHVWKNKYPFSSIIPKNFSRLFYAEYGAWADREYMTNTNYWSNLVEGTHCLFCALFSLISLYYYHLGYMQNFTIALSVTMGNQFMNSVLYLGEYVVQCYDSNSLNYNSEKFPTGYLLSNRPFMWINIFWVVMPSYIILNSLRIHNLALLIGITGKIL